MALDLEDCAKSALVEDRTQYQVVSDSRVLRLCAIGTRLGEFGEVGIGSSSGHDVFVVCGTKSEVLISEVVCERSSIMADEESSSLEVRVFMIEKEALWYDFEHSFS